MASGWRVLVTRRHLHSDGAAIAEAEAASAAIPLPDGVTLDRASDADLDRLASLLEHVLVDSLDERDRAAVAAHGIPAAARMLADELVGADPIDCIRFAVVDGADAGLVSWRAMADGRAFVLYVGVGAAHRGRGLAAALVAAATRALVADGAGPLIADTDDANVPMRRAFARAGWHATACRIDLELER